MAGEWKRLSLRDAGVTLIDCDHRTPPPAQKGYPYVAIPQLKNGRIDFSTARRITREQFVEWTKKAKPVANDVVLSRRCNPGETAFVQPGIEFALGQNLVLLRSDGKQVYPPFLRWLVRGPEWWDQISKFLNVGAVFDSLKCADVPKFELQIPPLKDQQAIACILGALDDKIELNRRMNETLEAIARAIFKSWFVDVTRDGLPEGWREASLDTVAHFLNGLALQKYPPDGEYSLPVIKIAQLRAGNTKGADRASSKIPTQYIVKDGDVLFSWSGSLEVELWCGGRGALNQHLFKVTSERFPKWFYFLWTRHHLASFQAVAAGKATTMGHIQRRHLTGATVLVPTADHLENIDRQMSPIIEKIVLNRLESRNLAALRDALLPKLLSGEIRVGDPKEPQIIEVS